MARQKRCSYCYQRGHTRPTCPELKKHIEENPNGYYARVQKRKAERKAARGRTIRVCSYCKEPGHNKATCPELKSDRAKLIKLNKRFAKDFLIGCHRFGFGPGALLELNYPEEAQDLFAIRDLDWTANNYGKLCMVIGFNERHLNSDLSDTEKYNPNKVCVQVRFPTGRQKWVELPADFKEICPNSHEGFRQKRGVWKIASGVDQGNLYKHFSEEWKNGTVSCDLQLGLEK